MTENKKPIEAKNNNKMSDNITTLKQLKDFLNSVPDERLENTHAYIHIVDATGYYVTEMGVTDEDHYLTDEGWAPVSTFEPYDEDDKLEDYDIQPAGQPFIFIE